MQLGLSAFQLALLMSLQEHSDLWGGPLAMDALPEKLYSLLHFFDSRMACRIGPFGKSARNVSPPTGEEHEQSGKGVLLSTSQNEAHWVLLLNTLVTCPISVSAKKEK